MLLPGEALRPAADHPHAQDLLHLVEREGVRFRVEPRHERFVEVTS